MASMYPPRKYAPGYARRDFRGGVFRQEVDPETGNVKSVQVPASYWKQPEEVILLEDLPEFWEHNNTQFTPKWAEAFDQRLRDEYLYVTCMYDPEVSEDEGATYKELVEKKEAFFDAVRTIETWPFWKYTKQRVYREFPNNSLVSGKFRDVCPEYDEYLDFKATRYRSNHRGSDYARWREDCLIRDKTRPDVFCITGARKQAYQYRDEELQLGEIEMQHDIGPSEDARTSIYEYFKGMNLVPTPGMADLSLIRQELAEQTGVEVPADVFTRAMAEHAARQADIEAAPEEEPGKLPMPGKSKREMEMDDLRRLVADLRPSDREQEVGGYGW